MAAAPRPGGVTGRAAEVLTLYNNGQPLAEVAGVYGVKLATVINHLYKAVLAGETLHSDGLLAASGLPAAEQARALAVFAELGTSHLRPVYEALGERVSYDELHLLRLYWVASRPGEKHKREKETRLAQTSHRPDPCPSRIIRIC